MTASKLFEPITLGEMSLSHRIVMAPLTRYRNTDLHTPLPLVVEYYSQRASHNAFIISEATFIAQKAGGDANAPGIYLEEQIAQWKKIVDVVHAKGGFIFLQLWALGRAADPEALKKENPELEYVSSSDVKLPNEPDRPAPRPLTIAEIEEYVQLHATAARNAVFKAGFDGVEIHNANGYLLNQFLEDVINNRTDAYGGSIENRARFTLEVVDAVVKAVGEQKTAIRFSPWTSVLGSRSADPLPVYEYVVKQLRDSHPNLAYIHAIEPRADGMITKEAQQGETNDGLRALWPGKWIRAGGFNRELAIKYADAHPNDLIAFGRLFISNPDLPLRLQNDIPLTKGDRALYYAPGSTDPIGYTSYPFAVVN